MMEIYIPDTDVKSLLIFLFPLVLYRASLKAGERSSSACRRCLVDWVELLHHVTEISTRMHAHYSQTGPWLYAVLWQRLVI